MIDTRESGSGIELNLSSGFTVFVKPLPPYYIDVIEEILPLPEFPTRKIVLAAGDIAEWPYEPTDEAASPDHEDYTLYAKWKSVKIQRESILQKRDKARKDFLLSNCVRVVTGPVKYESDDWVNRVEAAFENYTVPEHEGKRLLIFLKTQVIATPEELEVIINYALSPEVTVQGIINALQGFRDKVEKQKSARHYKKQIRRNGGL